MTVVLKFLDRRLSVDAKYGGRYDVDARPPLPDVLDQHLRARARCAADALGVNQEIRARCVRRPRVHAIAGPCVHRRARLPAGLASEPAEPAGACRTRRRCRRLPALPDACTPSGGNDPRVRALLEQWRAQEELAPRAAEHAGLDFGWREAERQDGQGVVIDGTGRPLWEGAVHPGGRYALCRQGPGRVLREPAVWRATLSRLDSPPNAAGRSCTAWPEPGPPAGPVHRRSRTTSGRAASGRGPPPGEVAFGSETAAAQPRKKAADLGFLPANGLSDSRRDDRI